MGLLGVDRVGRHPRKRVEPKVSVQVDSDWHAQKRHRRVTERAATARSSVIVIGMPTWARCRPGSKTGVSKRGVPVIASMIGPVIERRVVVAAFVVAAFVVVSVAMPCVIIDR
jgi:hypothetical protein